MKKVIILFLFSIALWGQDNSNVNKEDMAKAMEGVQQMMQQLNQSTADVVVIGFRDLKGVLPKTLLKMALHNAKGERNASMGMKISKASGEYGEQGNGPHIELEITDLGTLKGIMGMSMAGWSMMEIDRESDTELEQTFKYKDYKGMKKYQFDRKTGEVSLIMDQRVLVHYEFEQISLEQIEKILGETDFGAIEDLIAKVKKQAE